MITHAVIGTLNLLVGIILSVDYVQYAGAGYVYWAAALLVGAIFNVMSLVVQVALFFYESEGT